MTRRVLVSGYYGFGNTGDEAIAWSIVQQLRAQGDEPILLSSDPAHTSALYGCKAVPRMKPALVAALSRCDVLLSGGGGLLQDKTSDLNLLYYLGIIVLGLGLRKKVVVFNQSIGPLSSKGEQRVQSILRHVSCVVRDQASQDYLQRLGVQASLGGDPALLLSSSISVREKTVILAPRGDVTSSLPALRELTVKCQQHGYRVIALSFYPHEDDAAAQSLGADEWISTSDPQKALDVIAAAHYVVGVRLHALILAAAVGVPFCGVAYDPKVAGFCRDAGAYAHSTTPDPNELWSYVEAAQIDFSMIATMKQRAVHSFTFF